MKVRDLPITQEEYGARAKEPQRTGQRVFVTRWCTDFARGRWECEMEAFTDVDGALDRLETRVKRWFNNLYDEWIKVDKETGEMTVRPEAYEDLADPYGRTDEPVVPMEYLVKIQKAISEGELEDAVWLLGMLTETMAGEFIVMDIQESEVLR